MCNSVSLNDSKKLVVFESYQTYAQQLKENKYNNMCFNTLVADCEGALYYILRDEPTFLENFKKI